MALCYHVDAQRHDLPPPPEAPLWPRAVVPLGRLHARTGGGNRAGSRWRPRASRALCPRFPDRTRLCRLCRTPQDWTQGFWAAPPGLGGIAPYGLARSHPRRAGRRPQQSGRQGRSQQRWLVGGPLCLRLTQ
jgi:hypothetical protein